MKDLTHLLNDGEFLEFVTVKLVASEPVDLSHFGRLTRLLNDTSPAPARCASDVMYDLSCPYTCGQVAEACLNRLAPEWSKAPGPLSSVKSHPIPTPFRAQFRLWRNFGVAEDESGVTPAA